MNPYQTLNIKNATTQKQIKNAYRRLSKKYHPDAKGDVEDFLKIQKAYLFLSNPLWKARYDETGIWNDPQIQGSSKSSSDKCLEILSGILEGLIEADIPLDSPIKEVRSAINNLIEITKKNLSVLQIKLDRVSKILSGYNVKDEDILKLILDRKVLLIKDEMKPHEELIEASNNILDILKNYDDKIKYDERTERQKQLLNRINRMFPDTSMTAEWGK